MRRTAALFAVLCAVTMASCLGDDEDGDPSHYIAVTQLKAAYKTSTCQYYARCGLFPDAATCESAELGAAGVSFNLDENVIAAIGAGRVYYNGSNVKDCFDALAAKSCDKTSQSYRDTPAACRNVIAGTVLGGDACTIDAECISQQCSSGGGTNSCAMGTCVGSTAPTFEPAQIGETCSSNSGCVAGAYCDSFTDQCTTLKVQGDSCQLATECGYGLGCVGLSGSRTCGTVPALGESCATDFVCRDEGQFCNSSTQVCEQLGGEGATCTSSTQCSPFYPCDFNTSKCARGPGLGEACDSSRRCFAANTFCDFNTSTCVGLKSNGMSCNSDAECTSDFCDQSLTTPLCAMPTVCF